MLIYYFSREVEEYKFPDEFALTGYIEHYFSLSQNVWVKISVFGATLSDVQFLTKSKWIGEYVQPSSNSQPTQDGRKIVSTMLHDVDRDALEAVLMEVLQTVKQYIGLHEDVISFHTKDFTRPLTPQGIKDIHMILTAILENYSRLINVGQKYVYDTPSDKMEID